MLIKYVCFYGLVLSVWKFGYFRFGFYFLTNETNVLDSVGIFFLLIGSYLNTISLDSKWF